MPDDVPNAPGSLLRDGRRGRAAAALFTLALSLASACRAADDPQPGAGSSTAVSPVPGRPRPRTGGARLPATAGGDLSERGWERIDDLLWVRAQDADAWRKGLVPDDGGHLVPAAQVTAGGGRLRLRTDHVSFETDVPLEHALPLAREAEAQVRRLFRDWGEALGLRFPLDPLPVALHARRAQLELALHVAGLPTLPWNAWYDATSGVVHVSAEPPASGGLPIEADLRHEMTHQVLDLSTPAGASSPAFRRTSFWLWEGFALLAEAGDAPTPVSPLALRLARFERRLDVGDTERIPALLTLGQDRFEGRHYDQTASWMLFVMSDPVTRKAALDTLRQDLHGRAGPSFVMRLASPLAELEQRWRATLRRR